MAHFTKYETEVWRSPLGYWTFKLLRNGEPVSVPSLVMKMYGSRDAALSAAKSQAQLHRDLVRGPERIPLDI